MSCNHCGTKFNIFHKELGCANCGLALCSKCLKQKAKVPSKGSGEFSVCKTCYRKMNNSSQSQEIFEPPDKYLKRLENLENPAAPPITVYRENPTVTNLKCGLSPADKDIVDRLARLKEKEKAPPSDGEIRERLAKLKGENASQSTQQTRQFPPDTKTEQEKVESLLEQLGAEQSIEQTHSYTDNLAKRLATLKGEEHRDQAKSNDIEDEIDSEEEIHNITKKIVSQVSLEERCPLNTFKEVDEDTNDSPELPWCVLCNEDAVYKCLDCSGDLYCRSCSVDIHKE
ncbi:abscission/NoCut checkpoint regulator isoform X1 [Rhynchophorus ferrugineus]|uniref:abscission/NoCut checkpoint regulator isoform X1 n=1 Tax=Rhynchophorus ferrugineus TaxID=354439 RepID=UPI003FCD0EB6